MIRNILFEELKRIEDQLRSIELSDPVQEELPEASELGTASQQAFSHASVVAVKTKLNDLAHNIKHALQKIDTGTYGICDRCRKPIDPQRLEVLPIAATCQAC